MDSKQIFENKFIRQTLHQAYPYGRASGLRDIWSEAWCLRGLKIDEYSKLINFLLREKLISESGEDDYYFLTTKGENLLSG